MARRAWPAAGRRSRERPWRAPSCSRRVGREGERRGGVSRRMGAKRQQRTAVVGSTPRRLANSPTAPTAELRSTASLHPALTSPRAPGSGFAPPEAAGLPPPGAPPTSRCPPRPPALRGRRASRPSAAAARRPLHRRRRRRRHRRRRRQRLGAAPGHSAAASMASGTLLPAAGWLAGRGAGWARAGTTAKTPLPSRERGKSRRCCHECWATITCRGGSDREIRSATSLPRWRAARPGGLHRLTRISLAVATTQQAAQMQIRQHKGLRQTARLAAQGCSCRRAPTQRSSLRVHAAAAGAAPSSSCPLFGHIEAEILRPQDDAVRTWRVSWGQQAAQGRPAHAPHVPLALALRCQASSGGGGAAAAPLPAASAARWHWM